MNAILALPRQQRRPIVIIGGAVGDIVLTLAQLPRSGQDVIANAQGHQLGGCALNVARVLKKLGLDLINGIPVGNDTWGKQVAQEMTQLGLPILLRHQYRDNGWCLALVEPDGERTFISVEGCETDWQQFNLSRLSIPDNSIVYVSGYELAAAQSQPLQQWLLSLPESIRYFVDPGPRVIAIDPQFLSRLLARDTVLTLNRDEIVLLCGAGESLIDQVQHYLVAHPVTIIARLDSEGAWLCQPAQSPIYIPAYQVAVVDTIGAGDAHSGGVIAGLALGLSLPSAVALGNQVAAVVVNRRGASDPPTRAELAEFKFMAMNVCQTE